MADAVAARKDAPASPNGPGAGGVTGRLDRFFKISERGSSVRTELVAGLATFLTMAYILFVNPSILSGLEDGSGVQLGFPAVLTVTALAAGCMTLLMGVFANYPFALAAGLGLNAFVAFTLVAAQHLTWPQAMGVIVVEGLVISVLVVTGFREMVLNAIPMDLKRAIGIGIGLFITLIGLVGAGIVVKGQGTVVTLAPDLTTWPILVFLVGLFFTGALVARRVKGALLLGIVGTTILATVINELNGLRLWDAGVAALPHDVLATPDFNLLGNFSFSFFSALGTGAAIATVLAVMLSDFFDTMGTVVGIAGEANLLDEEGRLPGINRVLLVDSLAAAAGGAASSSSNTTFIESASGVAEGGRTGLTSVVVGVLFLLSLFIAPLAGVIPPQATAPVLVIVGYFMLSLVRDVDFGDPAMGIPVLLTVTLMPFTYSITNGVGAGFVSYTVIQLIRGRWREVHPLMYLVSAIFGWYFFHGVI